MFRVTPHLAPSNSEERLERHPDVAGIARHANDSALSARRSREGEIGIRFSFSSADADRHLQLLVRIDGTKMCGSKAGDESRGHTFIARLL